MKKLLLYCNAGASTILVDTVVVCVGGRSFLSQNSALEQDLMEVSSCTSSHFVDKALPD